MGYINDSLSVGEQVSAQFALHWIAKLPMVLWIILAIPTVGLTLILAIWEWLKLKNIEMGATNKRIIRKFGVISRKSEEIKVSAVETVEISQGVIARMMGFGNIKVTGRGVSALHFKRVADPMGVKRSIESIETT